MEDNWMVLPSHHTAVQMIGGPWSMAEIQVLLFLSSLSSKNPITSGRLLFFNLCSFLLSFFLSFFHYFRITSH
jgi:hypothetical protein